MIFQVILLSHLSVADIYIQVLQSLVHLGYIECMKERNKLVVDDTYVISRKKGNGVITRKVWVNKKGEIVKYSLAYINVNIFAPDSGRVIGYDNSHGFHHKHEMGRVIPVDFISFEETEKQFDAEFEEVHNDYTKNR